MEQYTCTPHYGYFTGQKSHRHPTSNIYQAISALRCVGCREQIPPGALLTRHRRGPHDPNVRGKKPFPPLQLYCRKCYPFTVTGRYPG